MPMILLILIKCLILKALCRLQSAFLVLHMSLYNLKLVLMEI